ncbi:MAG TPA: hypothetical protein VLH86_06445 [Patescibacteria group bacterium]|nr:hypothetical protein [Patescibacteria group bacterium]
MASIEQVSNAVMGSVEQLPTVELAGAFEAIEAAADVCVATGSTAPALVEAVAALNEAAGHASNARSSLQEGREKLTAYVSAITLGAGGSGQLQQNGIAASPRPHQDVYGTEKFRCWEDNECFHPVEIRALTYAAEELRDTGGTECAAMVALGNNLRDRCNAAKDPANPRTCPFIGEIATLAQYVDDHEQGRMEVAVARGARLRPYPLGEQYADFAKTVDEAVADAYFKFSRASGRAPEYIRQDPGSCVHITFILQQTLRARGIATQRMLYYAGGTYCHYFLRTIDIPGETFDVDGTWQQMLPDDTDYSTMPHAMILPRSQAEAAIKAHSVPENWRNVWPTAKPSQSQLWAYRMESVERIFEAEGWEW